MQLCARWDHVIHGVVCAMQIGNSWDGISDFGLPHVVRSRAKNGIHRLKVVHQLLHVISHFSLFYFSSYATTTVVAVIQWCVFVLVS